MKSNAIAAVGVTLVDLPLAVGPHRSFGYVAPKWNAVPVRRWHALQWRRYTRSGFPVVITQASRSGTARFVASISSRRHWRPPLADFFDCSRAASKEELFGRTSTDVGPVVAGATKTSGG
jgi:hypothetical protein